MLVCEPVCEDVCVLSREIHLSFPSLAFEKFLSQPVRVCVCVRMYECVRVCYLKLAPRTHTHTHPHTPTHAHTHTHTTPTHTHIKQVGSVSDRRKVGLPTSTNYVCICQARSFDCGCLQIALMCQFVLPDNHSWLHIERTD